MLSFYFGEKPIRKALSKKIGPIFATPAILWQVRCGQAISGIRFATLFFTQVAEIS
jgi:hypothetical protein